MGAPGPRAHADLRAANMSLVLRQLLTGPLSQTQIAQRTGLSKATVSNLVAELSSLGMLTAEAPSTSGTVGRPSTALRVAVGKVAGVGLEISPDALAITTVDLTGQVLSQHSHPLEDPIHRPGPVIKQVGRVLAEELARLRDQGTRVPRVALAQQGLLDYAHGRVHYSSTLDWHDVDLVAQVRQATTACLSKAETSASTTPQILLEHDAKLGALAVHRGYQAQGVDNLLYLSGGQGIGAGIIADGHLLRGWMGFTGEVGHMPVEPDGPACRCGRRGCWEAQVGFEAVVSHLPPSDPLRDASRPVPQRTAWLRQRYEEGDPPLLRRLEEVRSALERGLSILVDVLNPQVIVLSGWLAAFPDVLLEPTAQALRERRLEGSSLVRLEVSDLGPWAPSFGAGLLAIDSLLAEPATLLGLLPTTASEA